MLYTVFQKYCRQLHDRPIRGTSAAFMAPQGITGDAQLQGKGGLGQPQDSPDATERVPGTAPVHRNACCCQAHHEALLRRGRGNANTNPPVGGPGGSSAGAGVDSWAWDVSQASRSDAL